MSTDVSRAEFNALLKRVAKLEASKAPPGPAPLAGFFRLLDKQFERRERSLVFSSERVYSEYCAYAKRLRLDAVSLTEFRAATRRRYASL